MLINIVGFALNVARWYCVIQPWLRALNSVYRAYPVGELTDEQIQLLLNEAEKILREKIPTTGR